MKNPPTKQNQKHNVQECDVVFIWIDCAFIEQLKNDVCTQQGQESFLFITSQASWERHRNNISNNAKIFILAELNWEGHNYCNFHGFDIVRQLRSELGCIAPVLLCSFEDFSNAVNKEYIDTDQKNGELRIEKGVKLGVDFLRLPFTLNEHNDERLLDEILNNSKYWNKIKTAFDILLYYYSEQYNSHLHSLDLVLTVLIAQSKNIKLPQDFLDQISHTEFYGRVQAIYAAQEFLKGEKKENVVKVIGKGKLINQEYNKLYSVLKKKYNEKTFLSKILKELFEGKISNTKKMINLLVFFQEMRYQIQFFNTQSRLYANDSVGQYLKKVSKESIFFF